jgi:hypothetical protein
MLKSGRKPKRDAPINVENDADIHTEVAAASTANDAGIIEGNIAREQNDSVDKRPLSCRWQSMRSQSPTLALLVIKRYRINNN